MVQVRVRFFTCGEAVRSRKAFQSSRSFEFPSSIIWILKKFISDRDRRRSVEATALSVRESGHEMRQR